MQILTASVRKGGTASGIGDNSKPEDERWVNFARSMGSMAVPMAGVLAQMIGPNSGSSAGPIRVLDVAAGPWVDGSSGGEILAHVDVSAPGFAAGVGVAQRNTP